jgi:hypothetical protein
LGVRRSTFDIPLFRQNFLSSGKNFHFKIPIVKKPVLFTLLVIIGVGGFLLYNHYFSKKSIDPWDLIPEETILVYESGNCETCIQEIRNSPVSKIVALASFPDRSNDSLEILQDFLLSFGQPTLISLHTTKKDQFDFAFYFRNTATFNKKISVLMHPFSGKGAKRTQREFEGVIINEVAMKGTEFSWIELEDVWVGSFSAIIIEDVIRTSVDPTRSFKNSLGEIYQSHTVKNDAGNVFIHLRHLTEWFSLFTAESPGKIIEEFGQAALLDTKISDGKFVLNGFCSQSPENNTFLSAFSDQKPVPLNLKNIISNRSILVSSYGISDGMTFFTKLNERHKNPMADSLRIIFKEINEDPTALFAKFSGEVALTYLEGRNEALTKILMISDEKNADKWEKLFQKISETTTDDSVFVDHYSSYQIKELPLYRFPEKILYPLASGFDHGYYARVANTICIAEDIEELKSFLSDIDTENTWGKSVAQNRYLESTLLEANISLFVNTPRIWNMFGKSLKPKWQGLIKNNQSLLSSLGMGAIQFSHLNQNYYTNLSWAVKDAPLAKNEKREERLITVFESGASSMWLVDNHNDRSKEVLIQDSTKNLHLVSSGGKALWKLPLDQYVTGGIKQIDYLANGKLQYFFATPGKLHLVDRNGEYVAPYPLTIAEKKVQYVSVLDYDHSRKYRYLLSSREGNLWMFDKEGKNLEGWQPRSVEDELIAPANHHRMVGKDYLLAIRKDGNVFLMNRRGELVPNFPLNLNARLSGDYFISVGKSAAETAITVVSTDGSRIRFNIKGKVLSREVLVKTALDSRFWLCAELNNKSYVIVRQESKLFTVLDEKGNEIIKSDYIGRANVDVRYYSFGNGRTYIVVTDRSQELSYIFDKAGKLVTPVPIESSTIEILPEDNGRLRVFSITEKAFNMRVVP